MRGRDAEVQQRVKMKDGIMIIEQGERVTGKMRKEACREKMQNFAGKW